MKDTLLSLALINLKPVQVARMRVDNTIFNMKVMCGESSWTLIINGGSVINVISRSSSTS